MRHFDLVLELSRRTVTKMLGRAPTMLEIAPTVLGNTIGDLGVLREQENFATFHELLDDVIEFQSQLRQSCHPDQLRSLMRATFEAAGEMSGETMQPTSAQAEPSENRNALTPEELAKFGIEIERDG